MKPDIQPRLNALRFNSLQLLAPGPHALTPAVARALVAYRAEFTHRSEAYSQCYAKAVRLLRECFDVPDGYTPLIFGHTGSYCWEMVARNTSPAIRTVSMDIGAFSDKWSALFSELGRDVTILSAGWGEGVDIEDWGKEAKGAGLALVVHNETSTGVCVPLEEMCERLHVESPDTLLAVDGVSIAGAVDVSIRRLKPDYYLWSLQKDFAIPSIGSVMIVSDRAVEAARGVDHRGYVLDLVEWIHRSQSDQTPMTVSDLTLRCLIARLEEMLAEGAARFERHEAVSRMQRKWASDRGLATLARPGWESPTVTAIKLPEGVTGPELVRRAKETLNVVLAPGYGKTRDGMFRIAAMGMTSVETTERVLEGLSLILDNWDETK